jgi:hypothetical protein
MKTLNEFEATVKEGLTQIANGWKPMNYGETDEAMMKEIPAFYATMKAEFGKIKSDADLRAFVSDGSVEEFILKTFDTIEPNLFK